MEVSHSSREDTVLAEPVRKKRYSRAANSALVPVAGSRLTALEAVHSYKILTVPQLARLTQLSEPSARRLLRDLFDAELVNKVAVARSLVADDGEANDSNLTYGSAPAIHMITKKGMLALASKGLATQDECKSPLPDYGPKNALFLRHELLVGDIRAWLSVATKPHGVISWKTGVDSEITFTRGPKLRPDATFAIGVGMQIEVPLILSGFLEADRGTERGTSRWTEKVEAYHRIFADSASVVAATGYQNARVLVIAPTSIRRDWIWETIEQIGSKGGASHEFLGRFWIADKSILGDMDIKGLQWRVPGVNGMWALLPSFD